MDRNMSQYLPSKPMNFERFVRTNNALNDAAWCSKKVECARRMSPSSRIAGLTSREEYSILSFSAVDLVDWLFAAGGSMVKSIDYINASERAHSCAWKRILPPESTNLPLARAV